MDFLNRAVQVYACLIVHIHHHCAQLGGLLHVGFGVQSHVMHVKSLGASLGNRLNYGKSERYIRHENTVHNIQMKPLGFTPVDHFYLATEVQKVGRKQ